MKVNVKLDISDVERDVIADYIDKKQSNRLATRKDINNFVNGCIDAAISCHFPVNNTQEEEIERMRAAGHNDSYIRGWLQVGRSVT